jgi:hypothetical protein
MEFETKQIGSYGGRPATIIEVTVRLLNTKNGYDYLATVDVTDINGKVDPNLIMELRELANELEEQNRLVAEYE